MAGVLATASINPHTILEELRDRLQGYALTPREVEIVLLLIHGLCNKEIAARCGISLQTVKDHLRHVYDKTGIRQRTALMARILGLASP